jgi:hypothetical protein
MFLFHHCTSKPYARPSPLRHQALRAALPLFTCFVKNAKPYENVHETYYVAHDRSSGRLES